MRERRTHEVHGRTRSYIALVKIVRQKDIEEAWCSKVNMKIMGIFRLDKVPPCPEKGFQELCNCCHTSLSLSLSK